MTKYTTLTDAAVRKCPSDGNSIGSCNSLFGVGDETLNMICFELDVTQFPVDHKGGAWCSDSSSYSCCSFCRLPEVFEAEDDLESTIGISLAETFCADRSSNAFGFTACQPHRAMKTSMHCSPNIDAASLLSYRSCACNRHASNNNCCGPCENRFDLPFNSISIPSHVDSNIISTSATRPKHTRKICIRRDYLSKLIPDDALYHVLTFLDVDSLVQLGRCNGKLRSAASNNNAGWKLHCNLLWSRKVNVCQDAHELLLDANVPDTLENLTQFRRKNSAMEAYKTSIVIAKTRHEIKMEELCFDDTTGKTGIFWYFRFKESAGRDWTSWDPWWNGRSARKLVFLQDGTIMQAFPEGRNVSKNHNGTPLYDVFSERVVHGDGADVVQPRIEMKWRFVERPMDLPERPDGAYIRITVGGRDVPTYVVRRSPNGNWGFILESCWGVYANFDLAPQASLSSSRSNRRRLRRTRNGSRWVDIEDSDSESGSYVEEAGDRERNVRRRINLFVEESSMYITGYSQWREALLYNTGAVTLPEGNAAIDEFSSAWSSLMTR